VVGATAARRFVHGSTEESMNPPTPGPGLPPDRPVSLQERARQLRALNEQLRELNAHLEYLRLILKLGVR